MKIVIATSARFHVTDLARELLHLGHDVTFLSHVPAKRAEAYGIPRDKQRSLMPFALPALVWAKVAPKLAPNWREALLARLLDLGAAWRAPPCDVFIAMSGLYLTAPRLVKGRGAQVWLERGSKHILAQTDILAQIPGAKTPSRVIIRREIAGYDLADRIVAGSDHVAASFRKQAPEIADKVLVVPYGVNPTEFPLRDRPPPGPPWKAIMVGGWSIRKGCDLLEAAIRHIPDLELVHVGPIVDLKFPQGDPQFTHVDPVPQSALRTYYHDAHFFVLASREEGLAMVQAQALASGLPLVVSDQTGGRDLALTPGLAAMIHEFDSDGGGGGGLTQALSDMVHALGTHDQTTPSDADRSALSWTRYAQTYSALLAQFAAPRRPHT